nr:hypothetical protein [Tanacetum cinerariifolium]
MKTLYFSLFSYRRHPHFLFASVDFRRPWTVVNPPLLNAPEPTLIPQEPNPPDIYVAIYYILKIQFRFGSIFIMIWDERVQHSESLFNGKKFR